MPKIASGTSSAVSIPAGNVISLASSGGLMRYEYPTGTVIYEGRGANQTYGPYAGTANATIAALFGSVDYAVTPPPKNSGTVVLVGGSATVSNSVVTASNRIFLTGELDGGTPGFLRVSSRVPGVSFTITSSSGTDTSTVAYEILP